MNMNTQPLKVLIKRTATAFANRRRVMAAALREEGLTIASGGEGGSSFWMRAPNGMNTADLAERLREDSVLIEPGAPFFPDGKPPVEYYRLAYSSIPAARIPEGIGLIAKAMDGSG